MADKKSERLFTQKELDDKVDARFLEHRLQLEHLTATLDQATAKRDEYAAFAGVARTHIAELEAQVGTLKATLDGHRRHFLEHVATEALRAEHAAEEGIGYALPALLARCQVEQGERGDLTRVTYGAEQVADVRTAARAFLDEHPIFQAAPQGGSGTPRSLMATSPLAQRDMTREDPRALVIEGMRI
jgi:hypothetical protein